MAHHRRYARLRTPTADDMRIISYRRSLYALEFQPVEPLALKVGDTLYANGTMIEKLKEVLPLTMGAVPDIPPLTGMPVVPMPKWMEAGWRIRPTLGTRGGRKA